MYVNFSAPAPASADASRSGGADAGPIPKNTQITKVVMIEDMQLVLIAHFLSFYDKRMQISSNTFELCQPHILIEKPFLANV